MDFVVAVILALAVGFAAGFITFKRSTRWCPSCGATLRCAECPGRPYVPAMTGTTYRRPQYWRLIDHIKR